MAEQLAPKINPVYRQMVQVHGRAGAWADAIPTLVGALAEEDVAVTSAQKDGLRSLLVFRSEPLKYLEQLRIID
ncbi:hypothetical protein ACFQ07_26860 [Actinomadura adrarensis]|uniref:Uncharacterized protein n=1 Tax=Actinomadura adrarensis TaxID=1819600 RepID=A0ABW3CMZ2_9ACTN